MKTAVSIPDNIFKICEDLSHNMGISRSELYTKAIKEYIKKKNNDLMTQKLNDIYNKESSSLDSKISKIQYSSTNMEENQW